MLGSVDNWANDQLSTDPKKKGELDKPLKFSDGQGLFLLIQPNGKKYWRNSYRFDGKQKTLPLGVFPEVSLAEARELREDARGLLKKTKVDPSEQTSTRPMSENTLNFWFAAYGFC